MIRVCFLWHMHQPFYKDLVSGEYRMPWARLHALKDYLGMVEVLREFPAVRATFNLVPSLMVQLDDYARGTAREPLLGLVLKPAEELSRGERLAALANLFQANPDRVIARYPRYRELFEMYRVAGFSPEAALPRFSMRDFADLQVVSQLAWFDEIYLERDDEISALVRKGRGYTREDQAVIGRKQQELIARIPGAYREARERGQAELSTTPFYHPILPLVCDTAAALESNPSMPRPARFHHPEDARLQLERAIDLHARLFGQRPAGLWPSEGSVSDEAISLAAGLGFRWAASGEGVLGRSIGDGFHRDGQGIPRPAAALYGSYEFCPAAGAGESGLPAADPPLRMFFRDHYLSDLIGFVYSNMEAGAAARDFIERLRRCGRAAAESAPDPVISVILDGENAWEYYERSGRDFFRALYGGLSEDPEIRTITFSDACRLPPRGPLAHLVPGSWINANFDIWIGPPEDNRSWDLLRDAREFFGRAERQRPATLSREALDLAREELLIAEGSDWNWWYGPHHSSANDREFDQLYRTHLANVYRALGEPPPDALAVPIGCFEVRAYSAPPTDPITPRIDGLVSTYFEWMGAGVYRVEQRTSAMHGKLFYVSEVHYGRDTENVYVRVDFTPAGLSALEQSEVRLNFQYGQGFGRVSARVPEGANGGRRPVEVDLRYDAAPSDDPGARWTAAAGNGVDGSFYKVLELRAAIGALGLAAGEPCRFQLVVWESGLPVDVLPADGWLEV